ncbi:MAG: hypothetical protein LBE12_08465 [Planctomycetaceae bacterium]|jgi:hypothetical protein|nr:hypothetical protein [Planctomycetaceae bacterium]
MAIGAGIGAIAGAYHGGWKGAIVGAFAGMAAGGAVAIAAPFVTPIFTALGNQAFASILSTCNPSLALVGWIKAGVVLSANAASGAVLGAIGGFVNGAVWGTFFKNGDFNFDPANGYGLALHEAEIGLYAGAILSPLSYFLGKAPRPNGIDNPNLKADMIKAANNPSFRARADFWSQIRGKGKISWDILVQRLEKASFKEFNTGMQAARSGGGWAGQDVNGNWLFAVSEGFCYNSRLRHELFHGIQDMQVNLFARNAGPLGIVAAEASAHAFGGTLIGGLALGPSVTLTWAMLEIYDAWLETYDIEQSIYQKD